MLPNSCRNTFKEVAMTDARFRWSFLVVLIKGTVQVEHNLNGPHPVYSI